MLTRTLAFAAFLLVGCSAQEPRGICGESFCLPATAKLIDKKTPVEDFNIYDIDWRGAHFGIYEGNHPRRDRAQHNRTLQLPMDRSATISLSGGSGSVLVKVETKCQIGEPCWPQYLDVRGPCQSMDKCQVKAFAAELRRR